MVADLSSTGTPLSPFHARPMLKKLNVPVLMPFHKGIISLPEDFPNRFTFTDFIFLRTEHDRQGTGGTGLSASIEAFLALCKARSRKLCLITFSSMPAKASYVLGACVKMLSKSRHDFAVIFVGKRWKPRSVGPRLREQINEYSTQVRSGPASRPSLKSYSGTIDSPVHVEGRRAGDHIGCEPVHS